MNSEDISLDTYEDKKLDTVEAAENMNMDCTDGDEKSAEDEDKNSTEKIEITEDKNKKEGNTNQKIDTIIKYQFGEDEKVLALRRAASSAVETVRRSFHGAIEEVKKVQDEKNDYCLQQVLDMLHTMMTEGLQKVDDYLEESKIKHTTLQDLPDVWFKHLMKFLPLTDQNMLRQVSPTMKQKVTINSKHFRSYKINLNTDQLPVFPEFFHESKLPVSLSLSGLEMMD